MFEGSGVARGSLRRDRRGRAVGRLGTLLALCVLLPFQASACESDLIVGVWNPGRAGAGASGTAGAAGNAGRAGNGSSGSAGSGGDAAGSGGEGGCEASFVTEQAGASSGPVLTPIAVPWSTGFEDNLFCDYALARGFCYVIGDASYEGVTDPVHSGSNAAAFTVNSEGDSAQTRCALEGTFPRDAYYGAWFYLASGAESAGNWNLMYFNGGTESHPLPGLWDVSLEVGAGGRLSLYVFNQREDVRLAPADPPEVPIGAWFHVEFRLVRAADATGLVALYQDGVKILETSGIQTDDSIWGQWYVGNFAEARVPAISTVYLDDVSIRAAP